MSEPQTKPLSKVLLRISFFLFAIALGYGASVLLSIASNENDMYDVTCPSSKTQDVIISIAVQTNGHSDEVVMKHLTEIVCELFIEYPLTEFNNIQYVDILLEEK